MKFGSVIQLFSEKAQATLACNPFDNIVKDEIVKPVTTSPYGEASVRNTFVIQRVSEKDGFGDDQYVHYGQDIYLTLLPFPGESEVLSEKHYLYSEHITPLAASKFSRGQEVCMYPKMSGKAKWQFIWPDSKERFESEGAKVRVDNGVCIRHTYTGSFLGGDTVTYQNLFGSEYEVLCWNYVSTNKTQNLYGERVGAITADYALRRQALENIWSIRMGAKGAAAASASGEGEAAQGTQEGTQEASPAEQAE